MTETEKNKIYHLYRQGLPYNRIAKLTHWGRSTVGQVCREMGIHKGRGRPMKISSMQSASMYEMMRQGLDCGEIARRMHMSRSSVYYHLHKAKRKYDHRDA